jgi:phosphoethanolamine N-methyltransferase
MTTATSETATPRSYDNNGQYSRAGILRYEKIFGDGYVSTGGPETTAYLCAKLGDALRPGVRVLDVGSGIGGAAFHLAREYGAVVTGIDLSPEMIGIAQERSRQSAPGTSVTFHLADILTMPFEGIFDVIWSRDALMHIPDKPRLFSRLHDLLDAGGQLVITDYARGTSQGSPEFEEYVKQTGYHLTDPASYGKLLEGAGFAHVDVEDATEKFVDILRREPARLTANRSDFLASFREEDLNYLVERWAMKVRFCRAGEMKWGIYKASRDA